MPRLRAYAPSGIQTCDPLIMSRKHEPLHHSAINNNNNNRFLYSTFPNYDQSASQCIITPVIGFRHNSALRVHFLHSLGSIPASRRFTGAHMPTQPQFRSHPTGSPFNTWVESSNVDKVSCWRTKVPGDSGIRTRTLSVRVERSHHYTTAPPQE